MLPRRPDRPNCRIKRAPWQRLPLNVAAYLLLANLLLCVFPACSRSTGSETAANQDTERALEGRWRLVGFEAQTALEPMLTELLNAELGYLVVDLHAGQLDVRGRNINLTRRYVVIDHTGYQVRLGVFDEPGVLTNFQVRRVNDELVFKCLDTPWRGHGTLERVSDAADASESGSSKDEPSVDDDGVQLEVVPPENE